MTIKTYSLTNKARDLSSAMNTVVAGKGTFVTRFKIGPKATSHKHEWHEDAIVGRAFSVASYAGGKATLSVADFLKVRVGTRFQVVGTPVVFKITAVESGNKITATVHAANGNATKTTLAAGDKCRVISSPVKEASRDGDGDLPRRVIGTNYNHTQIIRKDCSISESALATATTDWVENDMRRQVENALDEAARDLNRCAIFGSRTERNDSTDTDGEAGGLYAFTVLEIDAANARIDSKLINDAVQKIIAAGGTPNAGYCTPGQVRVIANEAKNTVTILRDDPTRGVHASMVVNEITGASIDIIGDPDFTDEEAFVADDQCFAINYMRPISDTDSTPPDADYISRKIIGEFTFEFRNAAQRVCKIKNLKNPVAALEEIKNDQRTVNINATSVTVAPTTPA